MCIVYLHCISVERVSRECDGIIRCIRELLEIKMIDERCTVAYYHIPIKWFIVTGIVRKTSEKLSSGWSYILLCV